MRYKVILFWLLAFSTISCQLPSRTNSIAPTPGNDPTATAKLFLEHLHAGRAADAFQMFAINERMPKLFVEDERGDLERISVSAMTGQWHMTIIEIHTEGDGAVVVVNEDAKRGKPSFDLDPLYVVRLDGVWWIVPGMTSHKPASVLLSEKEYTVFKTLEEWFNKRSQELKHEMNGS